MTMTCLLLSLAFTAAYIAVWRGMKGPAWNQKRVRGLMVALMAAASASLSYFLTAVGIYTPILFH